MKRKFLITIVIVVTILIALWIWTIATPRTMMINIGGSSSIDPLMQRLTNKYRRGDQQSFIYSSTGSNTGITNLQEGVYDIAFISKDVSESDFPGLQQLTTSDFNNELGTPLGAPKFRENMYAEGSGYRAVTFTNEPIVFVYNIERTGLTEDDPFIDQFIFKLATTFAEAELDAQGKAVIKAIYDHDHPETFITWHDLARLLFAGSWDYSHLSKKTKVWPYASVPGSGTWTSFTRITGVEPGEAVNKYGNNGSIFYQILKSPGSFGFISMTYAQTIARDKSLSKKLKTVGIQQGDDIWWVHKDPDKPNYPLTRPFNVVFKMDAEPKDRRRMDAILDFIYWFCMDPEARPIFQELGLSQAMVAAPTSSNLNTFNLVWTLNPFILEERGHDRK